MLLDPTTEKIMKVSKTKAKRFCCNTSSKGGGPFPLC
jgi:hypothetical protein